MHATMARHANTNPRSFRPGGGGDIPMTECNPLDILARNLIMTPQKRCEEMAGTQYAIGRLALSGGGGRVHRTLECGAVPIGEAGAGCVRALTKVKQRSAGRRGGGHVVIQEKKLAQLLVIKNGFWKELWPREDLQIRGPLE